MKLSKFFGQRLAEFQFGRLLTGLFQFLWFVPVYFKMFNLTRAQVVLFILLACVSIWIIGWLAYKFGIVKQFRKKEFEGIL